MLKKYFFVILLSVFSLTVHAALGTGDTKKRSADFLKELRKATVLRDHPRPKAKVLIITTTGGGGHMTAARGVQKVLENFQDDDKFTYEIKMIFANDSSTIGKAADQFWDVCFKSGEYELLHQGTALLGGVQQIANLFDQVPGVNLTRDKILGLEKMLFQYGRPDIIVSVMPMINKDIFEVARKHKIPFRVLPTDFLVNNFFVGLRDISHDVDFMALAPLDHPKVLGYFRDLNIPYDITDYPINLDFADFALDYRAGEFDALDSVKELARRYHVSAKDKSIFVMMGAKGFDEDVLRLYLYALKDHHQRLLQPEQKLHIFVAAGKNDELRGFTSGLNTGLDPETSKVVFHALPELNSKLVAQFMALSDVIFSKPGGASTSEIIAIGKKSIFSLNPIDHERFNASIVQEMQWGETLDLIKRKSMYHPLHFDPMSIAKVLPWQWSLPGVGEFAQYKDENKIDVERTIAVFKSMLQDEREYVQAPENHFKDKFKQHIEKSILKSQAERLK